MPDRVTLITGASRGIGHATALHLAELGHEVINLSRGEPETPLPVTTYLVDLRDPDGTGAALEEITARHDVDNLVNNAGAINVASVDALSVQDLQDLVSVNLRAVMQCIQAVTPAMTRKGRGRIVNLGSRAALGKATRTLYSMTKSGLLGLSRSLALELAPAGITVNVISPGPIETAMFRENSEAGDDAVERLVGSIPLGRMGRPEDVAGAIAFFLADDASFVTGQNLFVCGGLSVGFAQI